MLKYIILFLFGLFIFSCSEDINHTYNSLSPKILSITRAPSVSGIDIKQQLVIEFSADINIDAAVEGIVESSIFGLAQVDSYILDSTSPIVISDESEVFVDATIAVDSTNLKKIIITPFKYLSPNATYSITVTTDLLDVYGNSLNEDAKLTFTTAADSSNPGGEISFVDSNPKDVAITVDPNSNIAIEFDRFIAPSLNKLFTVSTGGNEVLGTIKQFNSKATFIPSLPLSLSTSYDINMINPPTDLFGNEYDQTSGMNWSFTTGSSEIGNGAYVPNAGSSINIGTGGHLLCYYPLGGGDEDMIAVARDGGVDFYDVSAGTFIKHPFSLSIASAVTEMVFVDGTNLNDAMLISTMSDGIYKIQTDGTNSTVSRYLESEPAIYGIAYGKDGSGVVDRVYAVGPQMGMKIFTVDGSGDMTFDKTVAIDGEPLKVVGYTYSLAALIRKTYVSDYTNGVRVFDENGTSPSLISVNGNIKHIAYANDTLSDKIYAINSIGNIYWIDADTPTTATFETSILSNVNDMNNDINDLYISTIKDGFFFYDLGSISTMYLLKSSGNIVSSINAGGWRISLDSDGTLNIYEQIA